MELNDVIQALSVMEMGQPLPREALAEAARLQESITPVLTGAIHRTYEKIVSSDDTVTDDPEYELSFYAFFLLAQFREQSVFPQLLQILKLDEDGLETMLGDLVSTIGPVLYSTYNGDLEAVYALIADDSLTPSARGAGLQLLDGLLQDGRLSRDECIRFLRERLEALGDSEDEAVFGSYVASTITDNDLYELVEDVREAYRLEKIDFMAMGGFSQFFDFLYNEDEYPEHTEMIEDAARALEGWACFKSEEPDRSKVEDILNWKAGRNDPCPCGSGKKFKKCCLPKQEKLLLTQDIWEIPWDTYPPVRRERGRPGLAEFYNEDALTVDRLAYQGMHWYGYRPPLWKRLSPYEQRQVRSDARRFLWDAFEKFQEICARNGLDSPETYDREHKVHYCCREWLEALRELLLERDDQRVQKVDAVLSRKS